VVKPDPAEESGVAENEGALRLAQNKVVMFFGREAGRLDPQFTCHAEMKADPVPSGEFEEHLLSPGGGAEKAAAG
jgi:hypothetical protein